jgi:hypothetical protein
MEVSINGGPWKQEIMERSEFDKEPEVTNQQLGIDRLRSACKEANATSNAARKAVLERAEGFKV